MIHVAPTMHRLGVLIVFLLAAIPVRAQDARPAFTVGTATATRGTTALGAIVVPAGPDSGLRMPVAVIHGARPDLLSHSSPAPMAPSTRPLLRCSD